MERDSCPATNNITPTPNVNAARIVRESTAADNPLAADIDAALREWSAHIQRVDERGMSLLKAAFEAGRGK